MRHKPLSRTIALRREFYEQWVLWFWMHASLIHVELRFIYSTSKYRRARKGQSLEKSQYESQLQYRKDKETLAMTRIWYSPRRFSVSILKNQGKNFTQHKFIFGSNLGSRDFRVYSLCATQCKLVVREKFSIIVINNIIIITECWEVFKKPAKSMLNFC